MTRFIYKNKKKTYVTITTGGSKMKFLKDEGGQGAAEYILLFGGVIVIAIAALVIYRSYINRGTNLDVSQDIENVRSTVTSGN